MALGPAMIMGGLAILALASMGGGKKAEGAASGPSPLPKGLPGSPLPPLPQGMKAVPGPIPVMLPEELADLMGRSLKELTVTDTGAVTGPVSPEAVQRATTVAAQIEQAGFPDVAKAFRVFIQRASAKVPSPPIDKQVPVPKGVSPALRDQINRAIQLERDPNKLGAILSALLNSAPPSPERDNLAEMLATAIKQAQAAIVMADTLTKTNEVLKTPGPPPATTKPVPVIEVLPEQIITAPAPSVFVAPSLPVAPLDTPDSVEKRRAVSTANHLINKVIDMGGDVKKAKGKEDQSMVKAFQTAEGLGADGKSGPGTTLKFAKYTGDIPPVYYWPQSATATKVNEFRSTLRQMADVHEQAGRTAIATKLRAAAARERGQAGIVGPMPA